jgi:hypothetical protein
MIDDEDEDDPIAVLRSITAEGLPRSASTDKDRTVVELIVIAKQNAELWRSPLGDGYATFKREGHTEHHAVAGREFKDWLADKYGEDHQIEIDGELVPDYPKQAHQNEAQFKIQAHARRGEEKQPKHRVTVHDGDLWIDLGRPDWLGVRVNAEGWRIAPQLVPPLVRGKGTRALPLPQGDGRIDDLREFVNLTDNDFALFCGNLAAMYNVFGNYLTTILCGPPGSGKSTVTRLIRRLADPHAVETRRFSTVRDLMHGGTHLIALENVSEIRPELSDTICSLNTGTEYAERKYYAQGEEWTAAHHCLVIINGIPGNLAERSDLADRTVTFAFNYLGENVRSDDVFWQRFDAKRPRLFGAILDGLVGAMQVRRHYSGDNDAAAEDLLGGWKTRFVDAVVWGEAACRAMGFAEGQFVAAYKNNRDAGKRWIAENDPVCMGIIKLMRQRKGKTWRGYPTRLVEDLRPYTQDRVLPANSVTRDLPQIVPILRDLYDIEVTMKKRLARNDNSNGIIIRVGVGGGTYSDDGDTGDGETK